MLLTRLSHIAAALRACFGMPAEQADATRPRLLVSFDLATGAVYGWQINEGHKPSLLDQHVQHLGFPA